MDQFSNIEKLNLNDLTEEYIDIYVPLEVIEGNSIKNINLNYDLSEPSANDLIMLRPCVIFFLAAFKLST